MNKLIPILLLIFICGCGRPVVTSTQLKTAYNDGFEVIVIQNGDLTQAKSLKLKEAETLISSNSNHTLTLPIEGLDNLEKTIEYSNKQSPTSSYPFVGITVTKDNSSEIIDLSFHYSKSTFHYCYKVENRKITPLWSSYRDFNKDKKTIYEENPNNSAPTNSEDAVAEP